MHVRRHGNIIQVQKVRQMDIFTSYSLLAGGDGTAKVIVIALCTPKDELERGFHAPAVPHPPMHWHESTHVLTAYLQAVLCNGRWYASTNPGGYPSCQPQGHQMMCTFLEPWCQGFQ
jgi:hypothetical protein